MVHKILGSPYREATAVTIPHGNLVDDYAVTAYSI